MTVYDEPSGRRHRVAQRLADPRVVVAMCGLVIALVGLRKHRPPVLVECDRGCWRDLERVDSV